MSQRLTAFALAAAFFACIGTLSQATLAYAQQKEEKPKEEKPKEEKKKKAGEEPTVEQIIEGFVIPIYGGRERLKTIQRNGLERGRITRTNDEGQTEEITYERRFIRGESSDKDKIRLDNKSSSQEISYVYNNGRIFGILRGTVFTPRQEAVTSFLMPTHRSIEALLRYKENGATVSYVGKDKQKNIDMWIVDLTDKDKRRTRYYISSQRGRILWLEYEDTGSKGQPAKFKRTFHDYTYAQGTLVPYRTVLYEDEKQVEQSRVLTVSYGLKMDDSVFSNGEQTSTAQSSDNKP